MVFTSAAYWGDVVPFVPIANELVRRGHDVVYCVPQGHHDLLRHERFSLADAGVPFSPRDLRHDAVHRRMVGRYGLRLAGLVLGRYYLATFTLGYMDAIVAHTSAALVGADLMVTHPTMGVNTGIAADLAGVPWITGHLFPMMLPSIERVPWTLPLPVPRNAAGRVVNRVLWFGARVVIGRAMFDRQINAYRRGRGLAPIQAAAAFGGVSPRHTVLLSSAHYVDVPRDWSQHGIDVTGFTQWDGPAGPAVPSEVSAFLDGGAPPVLVTLGTAASEAGIEAFHAVAVALDELGLRGLFLVGPESDLRASDLPGRTAVVAFAPLSEILPRCRAIVQAGGHGTNAAAMHAGVPSVIVPFLFDQLWHGRRLTELGLGRLVRRWRRGGALRRAITDVTTDPVYVDRCQRMAQRLATEDGIGAACDHIEACLRQLIAPARGPVPG